jgi:CubicO group peptidase (beta-lactamase class C family)
LREIVHRKTGKTLDQYAAESFYEPMGLASMGYNPLNRFDRERITPSELDTVFRNANKSGEPFMIKAPPC